MRTRFKIIAVTAFMAATQLVGAAAWAQTKIFVIDETAIRKNSKLGKEIANTLGSVQAQGAEKLGLKSLGQEIKTEQDALKPQTQSLSKEALDSNPTLKSRVEALGKKQNEYMQKAGGLEQVMEQQNQNLSMAFAQVLEPAVAYVAKQAGADVVLSYSSTWYVKDSVDLSSKVVARLDATIPTLDALKAALTPPPAATPAGGAAPAAQPPATKPPGTP